MAASVRTTTAPAEKQVILGRRAGRLDPPGRQGRTDARARRYSEMIRIVGLKVGVRG